MQVLLPPLEERVLAHLQEHVEIARGSVIGAGLAFIGETQTRTIVDSGGNIDLQLALHLLIAVAAALAARVADDLSRAVAAAARAPDGDETLLVKNLAASVVGRTCARATAGFRPGRAAPAAHFH